MSESEKLTAAIAEYERETTQLTADVADLEQSLVTATTTAEQAIATAERRVDDATQAAAVDAEQERQRLAAALSRKRLALTAATADLQAARQALATSKRAAQFVHIQTVLDEIAARCSAIHNDPMQPALWGELAEQVALAKRLWATAGGRSNDWIGDVVWAKNKLHNALSIHCDWAIGKRVESPPPIPAMTELMQLKRANGFAKELLGVA